MSPTQTSATGCTEMCNFRHSASTWGGGRVISGTQLHPSILSSATPAPRSPALLSLDEKWPPAALVRGYIHLHSRDVHPRSSASFDLNLAPSFSPSAFATTAQFSRPRRPAVPSVPPEQVLQFSVAAGVRGIKSSPVWMRLPGWRQQRDGAAGCSTPLRVLDYGFFCFCSG